MRQFVIKDNPNLIIPAEIIVRYTQMISKSVEYNKIQGHQVTHYTPVRFLSDLSRVQTIAGKKINHRR